MSKLDKIGFGGGCHWCTEAIFQSIKGVINVEQGWIASKGEAISFSEAVVVSFDTAIISLAVLLEIHSHTHKSTSEHSMRKKYRSAVYVFNNHQKEEIDQLFMNLQEKFEKKLITQVLPFSEFKPSGAEVKDYYYKNPQKPFCETFINPKLQLLLSVFTDHVDQDKLKH